MTNAHPDDMAFPGLPGLFDDHPLPGMPLTVIGNVDVSQLSPDRRRTARQQHDVTVGRHPLTRGPLHELASTRRTPESGKTDPYTCGTCVFRQSLSHHTRDYPKCVAGRTPEGVLPRASHGAASDVRAWWPACPDYATTEPKEADHG